MFPRRSFQLHKNRHCFRFLWNLSMISNPAFFKSIYVDLGYVSTASHLRSCPRWRIRMSSTSSKVERPSTINNKLKGWQTYVVSSCCEAIYQVVWDICHQELRWELFSSHPALCKVIEQGSHKELTAKEAFWFERRSFQALTYQELPELARVVCTKHWQQRKEQWWHDRSIANELQSSHGAETALWNRYLGLPGFRQRRERAEGQSCCHCSLVRKRKKRMDFGVAPAPQRSGCLIECAARLHCWVLMASLATFSIDYLWIWHKHSFPSWRQEIVFLLNLSKAHLGFEVFLLAQRSQFQRQFCPSSLETLSLISPHDSPFAPGSVFWRFHENYLMSRVKKNKRILENMSQKTCLSPVSLPSQEGGFVCSQVWKGWGPAFFVGSNEWWMITGDKGWQTTTISDGWFRIVVLTKLVQGGRERERGWWNMISHSPRWKGQFSRILMLWNRFQVDRYWQLLAPSNNLLWQVEKIQSNMFWSG